MISTTAKHALKFRVLPRRIVSDIAIACFMINDEKLFNEIIALFDGKVDYIYIDVEQKQHVNLFEAARATVKQSELVTVKPNDITLESADLLIRYQFNDDLYDKKVIVIGTGNLASKLALRLAERQASVFIKGRTKEKQQALIKGLNLFLPSYTQPIQEIELIKNNKADLVVSFLSGQFTEEDALLPYIADNTFVIDGGINNFSSDFIQRMLAEDINITRLDTRIALPYQILSQHDYTQTFFKEVYGQSVIQKVTVASGGHIGAEGAVIVDNIKQPNQVIGIADGRGGVKGNEQLSEADEERIQKIRQTISEYH